MPFYYETPDGGLGTGAQFREQERAQDNAGLDQQGVLALLDPLELLELRRAVEDARLARDQGLAETAAGDAFARNSFADGIYDNERSFQRNLRNQSRSNASNFFANAGGFARSEANVYEAANQANASLVSARDASLTGNAATRLANEQNVFQTRSSAEETLALLVAALGPSYRYDQFGALGDQLFGTL